MPSYVVQPGDTLWDIAQRVLGAGNRWPELGYQGDPRRLPVGTTLTWGEPATLAPVAPAAAPPAAPQASIPAAPNPTVTPIEPGPVPVASSEQTDALAALRSVLEGYDLGSLADWAWTQIVEGRSQTEILQALRDRPEFRSRFAAIFARQDAGLPAISPEEVIGYETSVRQMMRQAGLPAGFYDEPNDFVRLLAADVSVSEVGARITDGYLRVSQAPPEVRAAFADLFGPSADAALATLFLDPTAAIPALERQILAAESTGAALRFGFALERGAAERLAGYGVGYQTALGGFEQLHEGRRLFEETISETTDLTVSGAGVEAAFGLSGEGALQRRAEERFASTAGGLGTAAGREGVTGLGQAGRR